MQWSDLLEPLDWGRQAVTNAGEGAAGLLGGDFSRDNFAKTIPAIAGLGAGLLTGGTMAPLAGAGAAALTQGIGKFFNPRAMQAMSTGDLVEKLGGDRDSTWQNMGMHLATDPFTYAGIGMAGGAAKGAEAAGLAGEAAAGGSRLGDLLGARRGIASLSINPGRLGGITTGPGASLGVREAKTILPDLKAAISQGARGLSGVGPESSTPFFAMPSDIIKEAGTGAARGTARHELYHSLVARAALQPSSADSGLGLVGRSAADLYRGAQPGGSRQALALLLDETGAHAVGAGSSPLKQALGGADHLFGLPEFMRPLIGRKTWESAARPWYSGDLHKMSPLVGNLYDALGVAPKAAVLGAAGVGTYYGAEPLFRE